MGRWVLLVEMEEMLDRKEVLRRGKEIRRRWGVRVDEDLTMEERMRWRMVEAAGKSEGKTGSGNQQEAVGGWKKMALR